jgi:hypothetical protein
MPPSRAAQARFYIVRISICRARQKSLKNRVDAARVGNCCHVDTGDARQKRRTSRQTPARHGMSFFPRYVYNRATSE